MNICCIETRKLPPEWTRHTVALPVDALPLLSAAGMRWVARALAETDPAYKQLIPYMLVRDHADRILCYPRHGSEARLHGLYSCGIGGHIDEIDRRDTLAETVTAGLMRELAEELADFKAEAIQFSYCGLINEAETPVGQVHLGLVYEARCVEGYLPTPAEELAGAQWLSADELRPLRKESWSDLAFQLV
ncbi:MAG: NUDIX domain-containing protein [Treponema sp.]|jgi:predicted NUDIX family phosphoesterase|nr:NUDIX domain-containing protein [Treponema sp.]